MPRRMTKQPDKQIQYKQQNDAGQNGLDSTLRYGNNSSASINIFVCDLAGQVNAKSHFLCNSEKPDSAYFRGCSVFTAEGIYSARNQ